MAVAESDGSKACSPPAYPISRARAGFAHGSLRLLASAGKRCNLQLLAGALSRPLPVGPPLVRACPAAVTPGRHVSETERAERAGGAAIGFAHSRAGTDSECGRARCRVLLSRSSTLSLSGSLPLSPRPLWNSWTQFAYEPCLETSEGLPAPCGRARPNPPRRRSAPERCEEPVTWRRRRSSLLLRQDRLQSSPLILAQRSSMHRGGAPVVVAAHRQRELDALVAEIELTGGQACALARDGGSVIFTSTVVGYSVGLPKMAATLRVDRVRSA
jgi:hypothetical protein